MEKLNEVIDEQVDDTDDFISLIKRQELDYFDEPWRRKPVQTHYRTKFLNSVKCVKMRLNDFFVFETYFLCKSITICIGKI